MKPAETDDHLPAPDPDRRVVRHELPLHAGAGLALELSGGPGRFRPHRGVLPHSVQEEKMDVGMCAYFPPALRGAARLCSLVKNQLKETGDAFCSERSASVSLRG